VGYNAKKTFKINLVDPNLCKYSTRDFGKSIKDINASVCFQCCNHQSFDDPVARISHALEVFSGERLLSSILRVNARSHAVLIGPTTSVFLKSVTVAMTGDDKCVVGLCSSTLRSSKRAFPQRSTQTVELQTTL